jgi:hypothetical protein
LPFTSHFPLSNSHFFIVPRAGLEPARPLLITGF